MKKIKLMILLIFSIFITSCSAGNSRLIELGNYEGHTYKAYTITVDVDSVAENIQTVFTHKNAIKCEITDRDTVAEGDFVLVDYTTYRNGTLYSTKTNEMLKVNAGYYLPDLERQLIGKKVGIVHSINVVMPDDYPVAEIAGETIRFDIIVKDFFYYEVPEMTDEYFQELGFQNYDEYLAYRIERKYDDLDIHERQLACQSILEQIAAVSKFKISQKQLQNYYDKIYRQQLEISRIYELSLEDYVASVLNMEYDDFDDFCMEKAELLIKTELVRDELIRMNGFDRLTTEELVEIGQSKYNIPFDFLVENDTRTLVTNRLLYDFLLEVSVAVE